MNDTATPTSPPHDEVAALRQRVTELERENERYRAQCDQSGLGIILWSVDGVALMLNPLAAHVLGGTPNDFVGMTLNELFGDVAGARYLARVRQVAETGTPVVVNDMIPLADGDTWYRSTLVRIVDAEGGVVGVQTIATDISALKQTEAQLREQAAIIANVSEAVVSLTPDMHICTWNAAASALYGWSAAEAIGQHFNRLVPTRYEDTTPDDVYAAFTRAGSWRGEGLQRRKDGVEISVLASITALRDDHGVMSGIVAVVHDITARVEAERALKASEARFQSFADNFPGMMFIKDADSRFVFGNRHAYEGVGKRYEDWLGTASSDYLPGDALAAVEAADRLALSGQRVVDSELRLERADGSVMWHRDVKFPLHGPNGEPLIGSIAFDITERKQVEEELARLQWLLAQGERLSRVGSFDWDFVENKVNWSRSFYEIHGLDPDSPPPDFDAFMALIHPDDLGAMLVAVQHAIATGEPYTMNARIHRHDTGELRHVHAVGDLVRDATGVPRRLVGAIQDVTDLREAERALRESEARFRAFMDNLPAHAVIKDEHCRHVFGNAYTVSKDGLSGEAWLGLKAHDLFTPETADAMEATERAVLRDGKVIDQEIRLERLDGRVVWERDIKFPLRGPQGERWTGTVALDITARRAAEQALRDSERRLSDALADRELAIATAKLGMWRVDLANNRLDWNDHALRMLGISPDDFDGTLASWHLTLHPDDAKRVADQLLNILSGQHVDHLPYRVVHTDGSVRHIVTAGGPIFGPNGGVVGMRGTNLDVTRIRQSEQALRESEARFRAFADNFPGLIMIKDEDLRHIYGSRLAYERPGLAYEDWLGTSTHDFFPAEQADLMDLIDREVLNDQRVVVCEVSNTTDQACTRWERDIKFPIAGPNGERWVGVIAVDITAEKLAQAELERVRWLLAQGERLAGVGSFDWEIESDVLSCSDEFARIHGLDPTARVPAFEDYLAHVHPDDRASYVDALARIRAGDSTFRHDYRVRRFDTGEIRHLHSAGELYTADGDHAPRRLVGAVQDVTDLRETERRLSDALAELALAVETAQLGVWRLHLDSGLVTRSFRLPLMQGAQPDDAGSSVTAMLDLVHPDDRVFVERKFASLLADGVAIETYFRVVLPNGEVRHVNTNAGAVRNDRGTVVGLIGVNMDVTGIKAAEQALRQSEARFRALFENALDALLVADDAARYVDANPAALAMLGYTLDELLSLHVSDITGDARTDETNAMWRRFIAAGRLEGEIEIVRKDGERRMTEFRAVANVRPGLHLSAMRDITDKRRAQAAEREQRALAEALAEMATALSQPIALDDVCEVVLDQIRRVVACDVAIIGRIADGIALPIAHRGLDADFVASIASGVPLSQTHLLQRAISEGRAVQAEWQPGMREVVPMPGLPDAHTRLALPLLVDSEVVGAIALYHRTPGFYTDDTITRLDGFVTHAALAFKKAAIYEAQRELSQRLVTAVEEERRRVAYDLHDDVGQSLTALRLQLSQLRDSCDHDNAVRARLAECIDAARAVLNRLREVSYGLRPPTLDTLGLDLTLSSICDDFAVRTGLAVTYHGASMPPLAEVAQIGLVRVLQEALTNAAKHGQASSVTVTLSHDDDGVALAITDDGRGFGTGELRTRKQAGLGLMGMRERAEAMGAQLQIVSAPGAGTTVRVQGVPLS